MLFVRAWQGFVINTVNIPLSSRYLSADVLKAKTLSEPGRTDQDQPPTWKRPERLFWGYVTKVMIELKPKQ